MAREVDPTKLSNPGVFLLRMSLFLFITCVIVAILFPAIARAFMANPGLNGLIIAVLLIGIALCVRQVVRLFKEVRWVNDFRLADPGLEMEKPPVLLAPMAVMLRDRIGRMAITTQTMRSLLESIAIRLDEARDISRYMTGLLVFLGLLGTFWGLTGTVSAVGNIISSLDVGSSDLGVIFEDLKSGLAAPLDGMGTAFSSSLFGLAGSLVLGFLDLQAGAAQNRFYTDLEDWLSTVTDLSAEMPLRGSGAEGSAINASVQAAIERLNRSVNEGGSSKAATAAMADLAEGIQGLVQHMRSEQKQMREWIEAQADQQAELTEVLKVLAAQGRKED
ncbi:MAG: flagellar motor protein MotA [Rhodobiaceae bacterium]|nr:flagellar motor protein MotA [Rhodobiaceae bacterium]MCC0057246.1 flagellar motor protein MotA [Rhodobiaceae bacterium]